MGKGKGEGRGERGEGKGEGKGQGKEEGKVIEEKEGGDGLEEWGNLLPKAEGIDPPGQTD